MINKKLTLSIVIPAFNEEGYLAGCLDAIAEQIVRPDEVIVVDNNSTDETAEIAASYPFVKLLREEKQGVLAARTKGFNAARGDVIGRIDADTRLSPTWSKTVLSHFTDYDTDALTGSAKYYGGPSGISRIADTLDLAIQRWVSARLAPYVHLSGNNMAIRRSAWHKVRAGLCDRQDFHEDQDLAIHLTRQGSKVKFVPEVEASISGRLVDKSIVDFYHYAHATPYTYAQHNLNRRKRLYANAPFICEMLSFFPSKLIYKLSNDQARRPNPVSWPQYDEA